jgi:hypothetical protein
VRAANYRFIESLNKNKNTFLFAIELINVIIPDYILDILHYNGPQIDDIWFAQHHRISRFLVNMLRSKIFVMSKSDILIIESCSRYNC